MHQSRTRKPQKLAGEKKKKKKKKKHGERVPPNKAVDNPWGFRVC